MSGTAAARGAVDTNNFPLFGSWGRWYPWFNSGFGWNLGYVSYDPWRYSNTRWIWGRYGMWYDPFDPFGYGYGYPYGSQYGYGSYNSGYYGAGGGYDDRAPAEKSRTGSIRLKAKPDTAKVYVDGTLVGTVDDFDGLGGHLVLDAGTHQLELRADGYVTYAGTLKVALGKTTTERITMKKK